MKVPRKEISMNDVIMTPLAVSLELRRSVGFVRNCALDGRLTPIRTTTNRLLFLKADVDALKARLVANDDEPESNHAA
jgi:hypothetical protein